MTTANFITSIEAAALLGESQTTGGANIRTLARSGKIPGAEKVGRDWLIPRAWAEEKAERKRLLAGDGKPRGRPPGQSKKSAAKTLGQYGQMKMHAGGA